MALYTQSHAVRELALGLCGAGVTGWSTSHLCSWHGTEAT